MPAQNVATKTPNEPVRVLPRDEFILWKILTSLRLTVICLALGILLVWVGTVAQADEGLYQAQARYFKHWIVVGATMWGYHVPLVLPGGYLLGTVLLANLLAAHIKRFKFTLRQFGINLTHFGIILLLVGQLATDMLSQESHLRMEEGETKNFSELAQSHELIFSHDAGNGRDEVVSIPRSIVAKGGTITHEKLPFTVRVNSYLPNSDVASREETIKMATESDLTRAFSMVAAEYASPEALVPMAERSQESPGRAAVWREALQAVGEKNSKNIVEAAKRVAAEPERATRLCVELKTRFQTQMADRFGRMGGATRIAADRLLKGEPVTEESLAVAASNGVGKSAVVVPVAVAKDMDTPNFPSAVIEIVPGGETKGTWLVSPFLRPQFFTAGGEEWRVTFRGERIYHPFAMKLLKATHEVYRGTEIPKNFQSRVRIENAATFESREVDIYMNNPLRYGGLTFYQYQMNKDEMSRDAGSSTLQVVRNPSWITPYLGCGIVFLGMLWQFGFHLVRFIGKRSTPTPAPTPAPA